MAKMHSTPVGKVSGGSMWTPNGKGNNTTMWKSFPGVQASTQATGAMKMSGKGKSMGHGKMGGSCPGCGG